MPNLLGYIVEHEEGLMSVVRTPRAASNDGTLWLGCDQIILFPTYQAAYGAIRKTIAERKRKYPNNTFLNYRYEYKVRKVLR